MTISGRAACVQCGTEIVSFSSRGRRYCSDACRQAAWRARNGLTPIDARAWEGTPIQRRRSDGYVNATSMCKAGGKDWFDYTRLDRTKAYILALKAVPGNPGTLLVRSIQGGKPGDQGTWIHPRLAVDLARWISPQFAVWMDGWFLEVMAGQQPQPRQRRRAQRIAPATAPASGPIAAEELFNLLSAVRPYLQEKEWNGQIAGEPEDGQLYQGLLAAIGSAHVTVGRMLRQVPVSSS